MTLMRLMTAAALLAFPVAASAGYGSDDGGVRTGCSTCADHVSTDDDSSSGVKAAPCGEPASPCDQASVDDASSVDTPKCGEPASPCGDDASSEDVTAAPIQAAYTPPVTAATSCSPCADDASSDDDDACGNPCGAPVVVAEPVVVHTVSYPQACAAPCVKTCSPSACSDRYAGDLRSMYDANLRELRFTSLALTRTADDDVADYLRDVQADRARANERIVALAEDTCIDLGPGPDEASLQAMLEPFRGECGPCLDQKIVAHLTSSQQDQLAMAEAAHERWDAMDRDNPDIDDVDDFAAWQVTQLNRDVDRGTMLEDDLAG